MNWRDAVINAWRYQEGLGVKPSARKSIEMARSVGAKFRNGDAFTLLEKFRGAPRVQEQVSRGAENTHTGSDAGAVGEQSGRAFTRVNKVSLVPKLHTLSYSSNTQEIVDAKKHKRKPKETDQQPFVLGLVADSAPAVIGVDDPSQPKWVIGMRSWALTVLDKSMADLSPAERFALAQYHAWRYANCSRDQDRNKQAARKIATGLLNIALHNKFGAVQVGDYITAATTAWLAGGRKPMHSPWSALSHLELNAA